MSGLDMVSSLDKLLLAASALQLGLLSPEDIIAEAAELLSELPSNVSLAQLAGAEPSMDCVMKLLSQTLALEGLSVPSVPEAGRILVRDISRAILAGKVSAPEGARTIWWQIVRRVPELESEFGHFVGLSSEWEDDYLNRNQYESDIRRAAAKVTRNP
jgi:hypothetical protein